MENIMYTHNPHTYLSTFKVENIVNKKCKKMVNKKRQEPLCGDTVNSLAGEKREF
jgi:hypothetical protein